MRMWFGVLAKQILKSMVLLRLQSLGAVRIKKSRSHTGDREYRVPLIQYASNGTRLQADIRHRHLDR